MHFGIRRDENHRQIDATLVQFILKIKTANERHAQIADNAPLQPLKIPFEEFHCVFENGIRQTNGFHQINKKKRRYRIIVNQIDFWLRWFNRSGIHRIFGISE